MRTFFESYWSRWSDMDFNQHMRTTAFLAVAEETRMRFLDAAGWPIAEFQRRQMGPVILEDKLTYRHELRLLEPFRVDLRVAALTEDGRRMKIRSRFLRESDGALCATVESVALWFDLAHRKPIVPPEDLKQVWEDLERTEDFEWFASSRPG